MTIVPSRRSPFFHQRYTTSSVRLLAFTYSLRRARCLPCHPITGLLHLPVVCDPIFRVTDQGPWPPSRASHSPRTTHHQGIITAHRASSSQASQLDATLLGIIIVADPSRPARPPSLPGSVPSAAGRNNSTSAWTRKSTTQD